MTAVAARPEHLHEQFDDPDQQSLTAHLGMWVFLATEVLFFGGMFIAYTHYRVSYPAAFAAGAKDMLVGIGTANTAILLTSSLFVALAHHCASTGNRKAVVGLLLATLAFGAAFLALKFYEYYDHYEKNLFPGSRFDLHRFASKVADPGAVELYYCFYFIMTGFHALHMIIGCGIFTVLTILAWRGTISPAYPTPVEIGGLYWHFVDVVWVFLYPMLYLIH